MRTVRIKFTQVMTPTTTLEIETEVFVSDDAEAREEGRRAMQVVNAIEDGLKETLEE